MIAVIPEYRGLALLLGCWLLLLVTPQLSVAHTLGVDKASLDEYAPGNYRLVSRVPPNLAPAITTPQLPGHCTFEGSPRGERGSYEVRFEFTCTPELTAEHEIVLPWQREGVLLTVTWLGEAPVTHFLRREGAHIVVPLDQFLAGSGSFWQGAKRYLRLGIEHILEGVDHLLFVLALLIMVHQGWRLVKTITAFTVAHSITLGLATLGYVHVPPAPVEASIALSIVFLCVEIVHAARGRVGITYRYPWVVAFAFGLLHGLGFAGALAEIGLPPAEIPQALLFFNLGVEVGQLLFVFAVLALLWLLGKLPVRWPVWLRLVPTYAIGGVAMFWFIERLQGVLPAVAI